MTYGRALTGALTDYNGVSEALGRRRVRYVRLMSRVRAAQAGRGAVPVEP